MEKRLYLSRSVHQDSQHDTYTYDKQKWLTAPNEPLTEYDQYGPQERFFHIRTTREAAYEAGYRYGSYRLSQRNEYVPYLLELELEAGDLDETIAIAQPIKNGRGEVDGGIRLTLEEAAYEKECILAVTGTDLSRLPLVVTRIDYKTNTHTKIFANAGTQVIDL